MKRSALIITLGLALAALAQGQETHVFVREESGGNAASSVGTRDVILINGPFAAYHYGGSNSLWVGSGPEEDVALRRSLLAFDLTTLPESARERKVRRAVLRLHVILVKGEGGRDWQAFVIKPQNAGWIEEPGEGGGKSIPNVCSWAHRQNFYQPWFGGEGLGQPGDGYESEPLEVLTPGAGGLLRAGSMVEIEVPSEVVEQWRGGENGGILLRLTEEGETASYIRFASSEHPDFKSRPVLEVEFE